MRAAVLSLFVLASYAPLAAETRKLPEVTYPVLDRILRDEKQTISERVDRVIDALPDHVARYNGDTRLIMPWFGKFKSLLPPNDYIRIVQRLTDLEADAARQASLMKSISVLKLRAGSRESRAAHYAEAISKGSVTTKEGATIFGTDAMIWAADEGLDSLENLLRSHAAELDAIGVPSSVQLARLEMRRFAVDLRDARERELRGYCSMNETQLTERLSDTAKRQAFSITVLSVCGDADQGLCDAAAQIVSKVSKAGSAQVAADGGGSSVRQGEIEETLSMLRLELMRSAGPKSQEARKRTGDGCRALAERSQSFPPS